MVWHDKHRLLAKPKPLAFLCGSYHLKGFPCAHLVGKECVPAIEDMGNRIDLMGTQRDFRADAAKHDVAPVILTRAGIVKGVIIVTGQAAPALRIFPYPVGKCLFDDFLLCLRRCGFLCVEYRLFIPMFVINIVKDTGIL